MNGHYHYVRSDLINNLGFNSGTRPNIIVDYEIAEPKKAMPIGTLVDAKGNTLKEVFATSAEQKEKKKLGYV